MIADVTIAGGSGGYGVAGLVHNGSLTVMATLTVTELIKLGTAQSIPLAVLLKTNRWWCIPWYFHRRMFRGYYH